MNTKQISALVFGGGDSQFRLDAFTLKNFDLLRHCLFDIIVPLDQRKTISIGEFNDMLSAYINKEVYKEKDYNELIKIVHEYFNVKRNDKSSKRIYVRPRQISCYFMRKYWEHYGFSYPKIGDIFGGKDHATIMSSIRTVNNLIETDKDFRNIIKELDKRLTLLF